MLVHDATVILYAADLCFLGRRPLMQRMKMISSTLKYCFKSFLRRKRKMVMEKIPCSVEEPVVQLARDTLGTHGLSMVLPLPL